jgi:hypothetical protein
MCYGRTDNSAISEAARRIVKSAENGTSKVLHQIKAGGNVTADCTGFERPPRKR